jgi:hypothetical protein
LAGTVSPSCFFSQASQSGHPPVELGDDHLSVGDLRRREVDRVGVGLELLAIFGQSERRSSLQRLELVALVRMRETERQRLSAL